MHVPKIIDNIYYNTLQQCARRKYIYIQYYTLGFRSTDIHASVSFLVRIIIPIEMKYNNTKLLLYTYTVHNVYAYTILYIRIGEVVDLLPAATIPIHTYIIVGIHT